MPDEPLAQPPTPHLSLPPTTTAQEDKVTEGQRRINLVWELTQAYIAIATVSGNIGVSIYFAIQRIPIGEYPIILSSSLFLVIGAYFQRTNHQIIGGTGAKATDNQPYRGR